MVIIWERAHLISFDDLGTCCQSHQSQKIFFCTCYRHSDLISEIFAKNLNTIHVKMTLYSEVGGHLYIVQPKFNSLVKENYFCANKK